MERRTIDGVGNAEKEGLRISREKGDATSTMRLGSKIVCYQTLFYCGVFFQFRFLICATLYFGELKQ